MYKIKYLNCNFDEYCVGTKAPSTIKCISFDELILVVKRPLWFAAHNSGSCRAFWAANCVNKHPICASQSR